MEMLKLHWSSSLKDGGKNFGDWLSPVLVKHLSQKDIVHAEPNNANLVAIGSILQRLKNNFWNRETNIWGSGFIAEQERVNFKHKIHAIRGKKSAYITKNADIVCFGDPGLLVCRILPNYKEIVKIYEIGIVCHYKDASHASVNAFKIQNPHIKFIDICAETTEFLKLVSQCKFIFSSSLHGLITADAFEIPNVRLNISNAVKGGDFKFLDYYSVYDEIIPECVTLSDIDHNIVKKLKDQYSRDKLNSIKQGLFDSFPFHSI